MEKEITSLLKAAEHGDLESADRLFQLIYSELRLIAKSHRRRWVGNETINTTALIHEAYLKLQGQGNWTSRTHFYATAARAMRQILVNYAQQKKAGKRGSGTPDLALDNVLLATEKAVEDSLSLHQLLTQIEKDKPRWCRIVECRFFGGMSIDETAAALDISSATVNREWKLASAYLYQQLNE